MATNPTLITTPFAQSGDKTTPPNTNTPSDGRFSQTLGFPPVTAIPLGSGGKAPKREDFNGAFYMLSSIAFYAQKGFTFNWDSGQAYYVGCRVIDSNDGNTYVCISDVAAGQTRPMNNAAKWEKADLANKADRSLSNLTKDGEDHFLERDFTIIYPNGGSESSPARVSKNSRYVETNPFPGYDVACIAEVYYNSQWGRTGFTATSNTASGGVTAGQLNDGSIVVQTGVDHLIHNGALGGSVFGHLSAGVVTPLPCRVKVWRIGKI